MEWWLEGQFIASTDNQPDDEPDDSAD
jgi:hypothetical protein